METAADLRAAWKMRYFKEKLSHLKRKE